MSSLFPTITVSPDMLDKDNQVLQAKLPDGQFTYLIGGNGMHLVKRTVLFDAVVKLDKTAVPNVEPSLRLHVPRIPLKDLREVEAFFREVYNKHKSEAAVILYACKTGWLIECPEQLVRGLSVNYDRGSMPRTILHEGQEYLRFGTIHSHANINAFHSGTDDADEKHIDGFHLTIGHVDKPQCSYSCRFMIHGTEFKADMQDWVELPKEQVVAAPEKWVKQVSAPPPPVYSTPTHAYPFNRPHSEYWDGSDWYEHGLQYRTGAVTDVTKKGDLTPATAASGTDVSTGAFRGKSRTPATGLSGPHVRLTIADTDRRQFEAESYGKRLAAENRAGDLQMLIKSAVCYQDPKPADLFTLEIIQNACHQCAFYVPGKACTRVLGIVSPLGSCRLYQDNENFDEKRWTDVDADLQAEEDVLRQQLVVANSCQSSGANGLRDEETKIIPLAQEGA